MTNRIYSKRNLTRIIALLGEEQKLEIFAYASRGNWEIAVDLMRKWVYQDNKSFTKKVWKKSQPVKGKHDTLTEGTSSKNKGKVDVQ